MEPKLQYRILVFISSILVFIFGVTQVVIAFSNDNIDTINTWAFFANGCTCVLTGFAGILTGFLQKTTFSKIYFLMTFLTVFEAIIVYIIYSAALPGYIERACGGDFFNPFCQGIKTYLSTATGVFWSWILLVIPASSYVAWKHLTVNGPTPGNIEMHSKN